VARTLAVADPTPDDETPPTSYDRITQALEWPMAICALAVIPALVIDNGSATPRVHAIALFTNWFVWVAFCRPARGDLRRRNVFMLLWNWDMFVAWGRILLEELTPACGLKASVLN
jgi:hypothetical protein